MIEKITKALFLPGNSPKTTPSFLLCNILINPGIKFTFSNSSNLENTTHFDTMSTITPNTAGITNVAGFFIKSILKWNPSPLPFDNLYKVLHRVQPLVVPYLFFSRIFHKCQKYLLRSFPKRYRYYAGFLLRSG